MLMHCLELLETGILHPMIFPKKENTSNQSPPGSWIISIISYTIQADLTLPLILGRCQGTTRNRYSTPYDHPKKNSNQSPPGSWTISIVLFTIIAGLTLLLMCGQYQGTASNRYSTPYDLPKKKFKPKSPWILDYKYCFVYNKRSFNFAANAQVLPWNSWEKGFYTL